jgi:anti-anti-sigma factor
MASFEVRTSTGPGRVVVTLTGECDLGVHDELMSVLRAAVDAAPLVVVDLAGLEFLDSSGLHDLVTAHHAARVHGAGSRWSTPPVWWPRCWT